MVSSIIIGLPLDGNLHELKNVISSRTDETRLHPVSTLMTLVNSLQEAENLMRYWKLSNNEFKLGIFIVTHRVVGVTAPFKYFQDLAVDGWNTVLISQVLLYLKRYDDVANLEKWKIPQLPLSGKDLLQAGVQPGREIGKFLKLAMKIWKESSYSLKKDELLALLLC